MNEPKRLRNEFEWEAPGTQHPMSPMPKPPHPKETRRPLYWLVLAGENPSELFFVNLTQDTLQVITTKSGGFETCDDDVLSFADDKGYAYRDILSGEAVKIEEFDGSYDLDRVFQVQLHVWSSSRGALRFVTATGKGTIPTHVLLWDSGEPGRQVSMTPIDEVYNVSQYD